MTALEPSLAEVNAMREKYGFRPYQGDLLHGARCELTQDDPRYPEALLKVRNSPQTLYCIGSTDALVEGLAVVGARRATPYGRACAQKFASMAAQWGIPIISGGARGCDSVAHRAALQEGAPTVVFLGGGCDQIYPATHASLFQDIIDSGGLIVSEHEWAHPALPYTFRERNRLIAGLAKAVLIVEAGLPSGTFSTADEALAASRDVLVVPGSIASPTSAGSNQLLYQGAYPIVDEDSFADALTRLFGVLHHETKGRWENPYASRVNVDEAERDILLEALLANPMRMDDIVRSVIPLLHGKPQPLPYIQIHLSELERDKLITRYPDGRYGPVKV